MLIKQLRRSKKNRDAEGANKATIEKEELQQEQQKI
jgi:hypothetical protein